MNGLSDRIELILVPSHKSHKSQVTLSPSKSKSLDFDKTLKKKEKMKKYKTHLRKHRESSCSQSS